MANRPIPNSEEISGLKKLYPSNSSISKEQSSLNNAKNETKKEPAKQIVTAKVRKQGLVRKLGKSIIEDSLETAKEKAYNEIIVPGFKELIFDTITEIFNVMLFGGEVSSRYQPTHTSRNRAESQTSYSGYYDQKNRRIPKRQDISYEPDTIIIDTRGEALAVLNELDSMIHRYGQASVADFYDLVGVTSDWTDNRYGWLNLREASIKPVRDGFMIILPRTRALDD